MVKIVTNSDWLCIVCGGGMRVEEDESALGQLP